MKKAKTDYVELSSDSTDKTTQATSSKLQDQETHHHHHQGLGITGKAGSSRSHQENPPEELETMIISKETELKKGREELEKRTAELKYFTEILKKSAPSSMGVNPERKRLVNSVYDKSEENDCLARELEELKTKLLSTEKAKDDGKMTNSLWITDRPINRSRSLLYHIAQQELKKMADMEKVSDMNSTEKDTKDDAGKMKGIDSNQGPVGDSSDTQRR